MVKQSTTDENNMLIRETSYIAYQIAKKLEKEGHDAFYMPPFKFDPRVFVNAVIADLELPSGEPLKNNTCTRCGKCVEACPSNALEGEGWKNVYRCAAYGCCGTCLAVCPVGR